MIFFLSFIVTFSTCPRTQGRLKKKKTSPVHQEPAIPIRTWVHPYHEIVFDKTCPSCILVIPDISRCVSKVNDFAPVLINSSIYNYSGTRLYFRTPYFFRYIWKSQLGNEETNKGIWMTMYIHFVCLCPLYSLSSWILIYRE